MTHRPKARRSCPPLLALGLLTLVGCDSADQQTRKLSKTTTGPRVENEPAKLAQPSKCIEKGLTPVARWLPVEGAPIDGSVRRAYHLCLGQHVALLRLRGTPGPRVVQVVLEQERYDVHGKLPNRRSQIVLSGVFEAGTVRYHRVRWHEGRANPGERGLRVRLATVDYADGKRWTAPPWPPSPRARPDSKAPRAPAIHEGLNSARGSLRKITGAIRKQRLKMEKKD